MRKIYLLMLLLISTTVMAQTPIITMVMSGECSGQTPKMMEIYAQGTVDFSLYSIENQTNANTTWGATSDLSALGTVTDDFVYIHSGGSAFADEFPSATRVMVSATLSVNGDDRLRIIETNGGAVIDEFGEDGVDGSGELWEYVKGYVKRNNNTGPDATFNMSNWTGHNEALIGQCGTTTYEVISGAGSYTMASGPTLSATPTTVSGFLQFVGTPSAE